MKLLGNLIEISSTKLDSYPGDDSGDSIIATLKGSAENGETAQVHGGPGIFSNPAKSVKGVRLRIGSIDVVISAINYKVPFPETPGETKVFSTDGEGEEKAAAIFRTDGTIELNGSDDNAVSYADLKTALDNFKASIDSAISGAITGHTHPGVTSGPSSTGPGAGAAPAVTVDISAAKVEEVKLP